MNKMEIHESQFGHTSKGEKITLFTLHNDQGTTVKICNYGATVTAIKTADKDGRHENIALGFGSFSDYISDFYLNNCPYLGAVCGRYANRIAKGTFTLSGEQFTLAQNDGQNHLHGGRLGWDKVVWSAKQFSFPNEVGVEMRYRSLHMEEGYPGNVDVLVTYSLNHKNELTISYKATTDRETVINLTNHTYFNLTGGKESIMNHLVQINAAHRTVNDDAAIPTGELAEVSGTVYDFTKLSRIGDQLNNLPKGYDLNYVLQNGGKLDQVARLAEETSGRLVEVYTTEPGIQFYTGYYMPEYRGKNGEHLFQYGGVALETQHFPDSPNRPGFPSTTLKPGETFQSKTIYKFGWL